jgi:hypothetical protein
MTGGYTLEGLDALGSLESLAFSLDSSAWQGGLSALSCVDSNHKISQFPFFFCLCLYSENRQK